MNAHFGKREKFRISSGGLVDNLAAARALYVSGEFLKAFDVYEQLVGAYPQQSVEILAEVYDRYQTLPQRDRYNLYQSRHFDFGIKPGDKVLDIGSGHIPFPLATHLSDITLTDHGYGRAGTPFKHVDGKPVYECSMEKMPFGDKEFDFVYCSHVLEHTKDPEKACRELMRVAKRGYIETPSRAKDIFLNSAKISNHTRYVELYEGRLIFADYSEEEIEGFQCDILQSMHCAPQTVREKAFAALIWLKADLVNTMLLWDGSFEFELRHSGAPESQTIPEQHDSAPAATSSADTPVPLKFLQVHTFYSQYLDGFYQRSPELKEAGFSTQINALVRDAFSGIHIFAPYMSEYGYEPQFIVANNMPSQVKWLLEHGIYELEKSDKLMQDIVRIQVETIKPDVLYLSDPISFDSNFVRSLTWQPTVVLGWRAANIPSGIDWSSFDIMFSSLSSLRKIALELGARSAEHFFPGYPTWINQLIEGVAPIYDVVFSGSWTTSQHPKRNKYITYLANAASDPLDGFTCGFYINGVQSELPPEVQRFNLGERFGVSMHAALRTGKIVVDARGILEYRNPSTGVVTDLAGRETANMRIFEATGSGCFLLAENYDNIKEYFTPGLEIETFCDEREMIDKIRYYLEHPLEREAIARRGQERCLRDYSMDRRAERFDVLLRRQISQKSILNAPYDNVQDVISLRDQAAKKLSANETSQAFDILIEAKKKKQPLKNIDLLRATCFMRMNQLGDARQALLEELRYFPDNEEAINFINQIDISCKSDAGMPDDVEFARIMSIIRPYTMLGDKRLYSLFTLAKQVCNLDIPGNFVECGVAAGGSSALLAYVIKTYSKRPRFLFSCDSFSGMPVPGEHDILAFNDTPAEDTGWGTGTCAAPVDSLLEISNKLGVVSVVRPVKGYYNETLHKFNSYIGEIAFIHIDSDWYESTKTILNSFYDQLHQEALIQFDDYGYWKGCGKALHEFESERGLHFIINQIDGNGVWFQKV